MLSSRELVVVEGGATCRSRASAIPHEVHRGRPHERREFTRGVLWTTGAPILGVSRVSSLVCRRAVAR